MNTRTQQKGTFDFQSFNLGFFSGIGVTLVAFVIIIVYFVNQLT